MKLRADEHETFLQVDTINLMGMAGYAKGFQNNTFFLQNLCNIPDSSEG